ncbi:unnamed protein product, partial [Symbiodinium microadriaticum]
VVGAICVCLDLRPVKQYPTLGGIVKGAAGETGLFNEQQLGKIQFSVANRTVHEAHNYIEHLGFGATSSTIATPKVRSNVGSVADFRCDFVHRFTMYFALLVKLSQRTSWPSDAGLAEPAIHARAVFGRKIQPQAFTVFAVDMVPQQQWRLCDQNTSCPWLFDACIVFFTTTRTCIFAEDGVDSLEHWAVEPAFVQALQLARNVLRQNHDEGNMDRAKKRFKSQGKDPRNFLQWPIRHLNYIDSILTEMSFGCLRSTGSVDAYLRRVASIHDGVLDVWKSVRTSWQQLLAQDLSMPVLSVKPVDMSRMQSADLWSVAIKSIIHTNAMYDMFSKPIMLHAVARVGAPTKTGLVQLWGDFSQLKARGETLKHSATWVIETKASVLQAAQNFVWAGKAGDIGSRHIQELWSAGVRCHCVSASVDYRVMRIYCAEVRRGNEGWVMPDALTKGAEVYVIVMSGSHVHEFQFMSLQRALRSESTGTCTSQLLFGSVSTGASASPTQGASSILADMHQQHPALVRGSLDEIQDRLSREQLGVVESIFHTGAGRVFDIQAPPGSGKSRCIGAVLKVWQDTLPVQAQKRGEDGVLIRPLAVLVTGKAALRAQLREAVMAFVEDDRVLLMESRSDLEAQCAGNPEYVSGALQAVADVAQEEALGDLRALDAAIDQEANPAVALQLLTRRYELLFTRLLWPRADLEARLYQDRVDILVATSDKLRKLLAHGSPFLRHRQLQILAMDEVEQEDFLDVVTAAMHFDVLIIAGDWSQRLRREHPQVPLAPILAMQRLVLGQVDVSACPGAGSSSLPDNADSVAKLRPGERSRQLQLQESWRFGPAVVKVAQRLLPQHASTLVAAPASGRQTKVQVVEVSISWKALRMSQEYGGVSTNFAYTLFAGLVFYALELTSQGWTAAVIVTYNATKAALEHLLDIVCSLPAEQLPVGYHRERLHILTVASAQGASFDAVFYVAAQPRHEEDLVINGHQLEAARRWIGLTRAKRQLVVLVSRMDRREGPARVSKAHDWAHELQSVAQASQVELLERTPHERQESIHRTYAVLGGSNRAAVHGLDSLLWRNWKYPALRATNSSQIPAAVWMQSPAEWRSAWEGMPWQVSTRAVPELRMPRPDTDQQADEVLVNLHHVPFQPVVQYGKTKWMVPTLLWSPGSGNCAWHGDNVCAPWLLQQTQRAAEVNSSLTGVPCSVTLERHKLVTEDVGFQRYYAQHCASIRGGYVIRDSSNRVLFKVYTGCGTSLQRADTYSNVCIVHTTSMLRAWLTVMSAERSGLRVVTQALSNSEKAAAEYETFCQWMRDQGTRFVHTRWQPALQEQGQSVAQELCAFGPGQDDFVPDWDPPDE